MSNNFKLITLICVIIACANANTVSSSSSETVRSKLIDLNEDNWQLMLEGEWMVEFFAPWCPACKNLSPVWKRFAIPAGDLGVKVAQIDVTTSPSLSGRFFVTALPTIYHVKEGVFRQYRGSRDHNAFQLFLNERQWDKIEPISSWKQPDSVQMSVLSYFFKLSHVLKEFNTRLHDEYGIPTWGSCALLTIATIFVGATLGLMLICVVDLVYPPKKSQRQSFTEAKERALNTSVEDIPKDEIEDDVVVGDDDEEEEEDENDSTSDGEKNSASESEEADEEEEKVEETSKNEEKSTTEIRKRKPRKAD